mgnify:CR=1 FL=1
MVVYTTYQTITPVPDEALAPPPVGEIRQAPEASPPGLEPVKKKKPFVNGAEGCVRETREGVLHEDDPHFQSFLKL